MTPLISVILPVRNVEKYVVRAVDSVLAQTLDDLELIVIDDHSDDETFIKVASMSDLRIRLVENPGKGIVDALNTGLALARGEFIARMDGDDVSMPRRFEMQVRCLRDMPDVGICSVMVRCFPRPEVSDWYKWYETMVNGLLTHEEILNAALIDTPLPHPTWMVRRGVFEAVGNYADGPFPEDYEWLLRAFRAGARAGRVPEVLLHWREHGHRASRHDSRYNLAGHLRVKALHIASIAHQRDVVILGGGRTAKNLITALKQAGVMPVQVVDIRPGRAGGLVKGIPVTGLSDFRWKKGQLVLIAIHSRTGSWLATKGLLKAGLKEGLDLFVTA